jgi:hypothetical protein
MKRKSEIKGYWWLPDDENNKLAGLLYTAEDGTHYLELFGSFENTPFLTKETNYEVINGFSSKGKYYTLAKSFIKNQSRSMPGFANITILVNIIFENFRAKTFEEIKFSTFYTTFSYIDDWILINGFNIDADNIKNTKVEYSQPEVLKYDINKEFILNVHFVAYPPPLTIITREVMLKQNIEIEIKTNNNTLEWFLD